MKLVSSVSLALGIPAEPAHHQLAIEAQGCQSQVELAARRARVALADPDEGEFLARAHEFVHDMQLLGRRHAAPSLDLALLDLRVGVGREGPHCERSLRHEPPRARVDEPLPVLPDRHAVHEHVAHSLRSVGGEAVGVGGEVAHAAQRAGRDGRRVEYGDVGARARAQHATALNPVIGYERSTELAAEAMKTGRGILELIREKKVLTEEQIRTVFDPAAMTGQGRPK